MAGGAQGLGNPCLWPAKSPWARKLNWSWKEREGSKEGRRMFGEYPLRLSALLNTQTILSYLQTPPWKPYVSAR